ncbi:MAG: LuxR C-terminal-related transcriptional regulator [Panacagrimonas sp.]
MNEGLHLDKSLNGSLAEAHRVLLNRDRVLDLDDGLPVLVIEGPSGYGKTSLAEMWLERQRNTGTCCWVSLDATSSDPVRFLEQWMRAVGADYPGRQESGMDDEAGRAERFSHLCARLAEDATGFRIVVDDGHVIANCASRPYLEKLLALASDRLRICLTMQPVKLDVGLGRLTAQGQASWIQGKCLALTRDEVAAFARLRGHALNCAQLDWLYRATEGWPALTQLALAAPVDESPTSEASIRESGPLREFIYERFLNGLSADEQDVLWTLSCLGSAPVPLLVELDPVPAKVELALLHFRALGIVQNRDADDASVTSLHALIREGASRLLEHQRSRSRRVLVREAAEWFWRNGYGAAAVRLALENGRELAQSAREWLVSLGFNFIFRSGQHQTYLDLVTRWEQVSGQTDPEIDETAAWALIFQREFALAEPRIERIEQTGQELQQATAALQRAVLVSLRDDYAQGGQLATRWRRQNEGSHSFLMGVASTVYAFSHKCVGNFDEAHVALREAMYCFNVAQSAYGIGWAHVVGSIMLVQAGSYRAALAQVESGLTRCPGSHGFGSLRALLRALQAFLHYERNELDRVREILGESLPLLSEQGVVDAVSLGYTAAARARAAAGDFGTALDLLAEGELIGVQRDFPRLTFTLRAERALFLMRSGAPSQARKIVESIPDDGGPRTTVQLLKARLALADGDGPSARSLVQPILAKMRKLGRQSRLCEILLQLALAEELCGNDTGAFAALGEALDIGSTEGYVRSFIDEGKNLRELIARWLKHRPLASRPATALAERLIALGEDGGERNSGPKVAATFNKRERQILSLLNEGLSNAQLARRCFISEGTVKWYLHNLYEKLEVGNRTALLRAVREQGVKLL